MKQSTSHILMVRPACFGFNEQTAASNSFQKLPTVHNLKLLAQAQLEFDEAANLLLLNGINVVVVNDSNNPVKPDAVFPNNWISFSHTGEVFIYPMLTPNRSSEVRMDMVEKLKYKFNIQKVIDLRMISGNRILEGTGSMVFDHNHKIAYASLSERTNKELFMEYCNEVDYRPVYFISKNSMNIPIYHTNVMMCIANKFAVICLECISSPSQRLQVENSLTETGHEIIDISYSQVLQFAGNMLTLKNNSGELLLVMSAGAEQSLTQLQRSSLLAHAQILTLAIPTIESIGGGSARCMIAEIFCPPL